ncbi:hypothetical protein V9K67_24450 [Paraflavisolibacter sp. H34]|uniref:hypothetical protein n=1 Tax=Huijunlia imazamoxiresistens TaxID=3127457 RepID=UPI00301B2C58
MEIITNLKEANLLLQRFQGATAQLYAYSLSLRRMAIKLILPQKNEVAYIIGVCCEHLVASFDWNNANLSILTDDKLDTGENMTKIIDKDSGFELITVGGFTVAFGLEEEFGDSFEDFIKAK